MPLLAVVTGGAQGLGAGIAEVLAENGVVVALVDIQREKLMEVRKKIIESGGQASAHVANVSNINSAKTLGSEIVLDHGTPDILVNNAGVLYFQDFLEGLSMNHYDCVLSALFQGDTESWAHMINTNIVGYLNTISVFLPMMKKNKKGHIINIGSSNSRDPAAGMAVYSGTKSFWLGMTPALRKEVRGTGIKITQVEPGAVRTEGVMKVMQNPTFEAVHEKFYPRSTEKIDKDFVHHKMIPRDIGEVVWDAIRTVDRVYEQDIYVGNRE